MSARVLRDSAPPAPEWHRLTRVDEKHRAFSADLYFREGWADAFAALGNCAHGVLHSIAMMTIKPDAVVGRRMPAILEYVVAHGFRPIACARMALTRHSMRELWRYDWHVYPIDRLAFSSIWYTAADVLMLLFEDVAPHRSWPASVRLAQRKGHWSPQFRSADDLRTVLRPPNRILNFVHVAEEPIDIVRELGILLDRDERRVAWSDAAANIGRDASASVLEHIRELEARHPAHDLDFVNSLLRLERSGAITSAAALRLRKLATNGQTLPWDDLCRIVAFDTPRTDRWDFISVAAAIVPCERTVTDLLPPLEVSRW